MSHLESCRLHPPSCRLHIADFDLQITSSILQIADWRLQVATCRLHCDECILQLTIAICRLHYVDCWLHSADWILKIILLRINFVFCNLRVGFLAAMSSSKSDDVTKSVRLFVCSFVVIFFLLVSLVFYLVLKGFNGVSRKF